MSSVQQILKIHHILVRGLLAKNISSPLHSHFFRTFAPVFSCFCSQEQFVPSAVVPLDLSPPCNLFLLVTLVEKKAISVCFSLIRQSVKSMEC